MEILEIITENWAAIVEEPVAFIAVAFICANGGFIFAYIIFRHQLMAAEQHLRLKDDQLADFRVKTKSANPDQAGERLAALERRVDRFEAELSQAANTDYVAIYEDAKRGGKSRAEAGMQLQRRNRSVF
ncbi:hypothetical protein [Paracoccus sanguinis]|uniref:hypothetical protein n=1 Tax=Paracoccus sanguinis TaxID=1545044 RepID=UPI0012DFF9ED|nr:hypothetical protein [Paracoccus sanguinis]